MGLYRRLNEVEDKAGLEAFAAELIDRFGKLPDPTENLIRLIEIKLNAKKACIARIALGPRGALVSFHDARPPNIAGLHGHVARLDRPAKQNGRTVGGGGGCTEG